MRMSYLTMATISAVFMLNGCSTSGHSPTMAANNFIHKNSVVHLTKEKYPAKSPTTVAVYAKDQRPQTPYRVIGVAKVSKKNMLGMQRHEQTVHDMMKHLAASIGGDGIIDMDNHEEHVEANIIQFQKILI